MALGGEEAPRQHEQVVELERAGDGPGERALEHEAGGDRADDRLAVLPPRRQVCVDGVHQRQLVGPQRFEGLDAELLPVRTIAAPVDALERRLHGVEPAKHVADTAGTGQPVGGRGQAFEQRFLAVAGRDGTRRRGGAPARARCRRPSPAAAADRAGRDPRRGPSWPGSPRRCAAAPWSHRRIPTGTAAPARPRSAQERPRGGRRRGARRAGPASARRAPAGSPARRAR